MKKPDLVFLTKENEERVKRAAEGKGFRCEDCGYAVTGPHDCNFELRNPEEGQVNGESTGKGSQA